MCPEGGSLGVDGLEGCGEGRQGSESGGGVSDDGVEVGSGKVQLFLVELVFLVAGIKKLVVDAVVPEPSAPAPGLLRNDSPLCKFQLIADVLSRLLTLQLPLLLQMGAHDVVKVAVRLCASGHGGRRWAIDASRVVLYGLGDGFYALDVSGALLHDNQSIHVRDNIPMERMVGLRWAARDATRDGDVWSFRQA